MFILSGWAKWLIVIVFRGKLLNNCLVRFSVLRLKLAMTLKVGKATHKT